MGAKIRIEIEGTAEEVAPIIGGINGALNREILLELIRQLQEMIAEQKEREESEGVVIEDVEVVEDEPNVMEEPTAEEKTPEKKTPNGDTIDLATEMILDTIPPKRGRPPRAPVKRYLSKVVKFGTVRVPEAKMRASDVDVLLRWHIVDKVKSEGVGYVIVPKKNVEKVIKEVILND